MLTSEDYRQLAERCALLASECTTPGVVEALKMLALHYLTKAALPAGRLQHKMLPADWFVGGGGAAGEDRSAIAFLNRCACDRCSVCAAASSGGGLKGVTGSQSAPDCQNAVAPLSSFHPWPRLSAAPGAGRTTTASPGEHR
jgi:hypothetical protein